MRVFGPRGWRLKSQPLSTPAGPREWPGRPLGRGGHRPANRLFWGGIRPLCDLAAHRHTACVGRAALCSSRPPATGGMHPSQPGRRRDVRRRGNAAAAVHRRGLQRQAAALGARLPPTQRIRNPTRSAGGLVLMTLVAQSMGFTPIQGQRSVQSDSFSAGNEFCGSTGRDEHECSQHTVQQPATRLNSMGARRVPAAQRPKEPFPCEPCSGSRTRSTLR